MTDEEKVKKIVDSIFSTGLNTYRTFYEMAYDSAIKMAEWKEEQFIEKACVWLENELPTHSEMRPLSIKFFVECFRRDFTNKK